MSKPFDHHHARKRFGQHWLKDRDVLRQILVAADLGQEDVVLEVGPGRGALTELLLNSPVAAVQAVELDRDLVAGLSERFAHDPRFSLLSGDVLRVPLPAATKVVANIPYNITGPLLERLVGRLDRPVREPYQRLVLLLQREVAERIRALPGSSCYSALSVRLQLLGRASKVCAVPARCFDPPPRVESEVIRYDPLPAAERLDPSLAQQLEQLLKVSFLARRKMLRNSLAPLLPLAELEPLAQRAGINLAQRPQEIAPAAWVALAKGLNQRSAMPRESE